MLLELAPKNQIKEIGELSGNEEGSEWIVSAEDWGKAGVLAGSGLSRPASPS